MSVTQISNMTEEPGDLELRRSHFKAQMSTLHTRQQQAVCVRRACKRYGSKSNPVIVLDGLNMTVPKGSIYGLLGASGCGKTTLLSCIVGRKKMNSGEIWVLGGTPGSRDSGVPGPRIGYMPQETALYAEFSIRESFKYFGWISGMSTEKIEERLQFLSNLFMLPDVEQLINTLSGGQQRRVSLAVTLLHEPELLILDEPTVGLDPVLRQNIWDHFVEITKHGKTTVIITTHYIEETRQAHLIGLMRGGYFLAEETPEKLLAKFSCESLENVFLKLSVIQNMGKMNPASIAHKVTEDIEVPSGFINEGAVLDEDEETTGEFGDNVSIASRRRVSITSEITESAPPQLTPDQEPPRQFSDYIQIMKAHHMYALMWKNSLWMWRNIAFMIFLIGLPVVQTILCCITIGHDPTGLHLSVVNYELEEAEACKIAPGCNSTRLSCNYLDNLQKRQLQLNFYSTEEDAKDSVRRGNTWAALIFSSNFSDAMKHRIEVGMNLPEWDIVSSSVEVYQDKSNENIAALLQRQLYFGLEDFFKDHLVTCGIDSKVGTVPIRWQRPIYGYDSPDFTDFVTPGVMITIVFFLAVASTVGSILIERKEGMLERCLVNGITGVELLFSLTITQFIIMIAQSSMVIVFTMIFNIPYNGDVIWATLLILSTGLCGMSFGFMVGSFCDDFNTATYVTVGSMFPFLLLCGVIWPIEGMAAALRPISYVLPLTKSTESLRSIMIRGWGISMPIVYEGFIATFIWIIIFLLLSIFFLRVKRG